jgi:hypothetical protein
MEREIQSRLSREGLSSNRFGTVSIGEGKSSMMKSLKGSELQLESASKSQ